MKQDFIVRHCQECGRKFVTMRLTMIYILLVRSMNFSVGYRCTDSIDAGTSTVSPCFKDTAFPSESSNSPGTF